MWHHRERGLLQPPGVSARPPPAARGVGAAILVRVIGATSRRQGEYCAPVIIAARSSGAETTREVAAPRRTGPARLPVLRGPQLIVDDAVHIAVVLAEVTGEILQVPEEVGAAVVPAEPPRAAPIVDLLSTGGASGGRRSRSQGPVLIVPVPSVPLSARLCLPVKDDAEGSRTRGTLLNDLQTRKVPRSCQ